ncbi:MULTISPECIES: hypothetical protein [Haloarcula]|uniref:hypothetical protein n=1 Tax=Haloarcula TaxID=2237 RepID=UPI0023E77102|nr:hypothetical protein [Halomicroarcula sp. SHR3]
MARGRAVAVVALLLLAGCQGFESDGGETVTPATVPTASGEATTDPAAIADRHRQALSNRSYTTTVALTVEYENATTARLIDEFAVGSNGAYRYQRRVRDPYPQAASNFTIWQNGSTEFRRETAENGTATVTVSDSVGFEDVTLSGFLRRVLRGFDLTAARANGQTQLTGEQTGPLTVPLPTALRDGRDGTLEAERRDGIVRSLTVDAQADHPDSDQSVTVRMRVTVKRVGRTDPERPAWATESNASG